APAGVRGAAARGDPLHLAREEGRLGAGRLCDRPWRAAPRATRLVPSGTAGESFSSIRFRSGAKSGRCRPDVTTPRLLLRAAAVRGVPWVPSPAGAAHARTTDRALGRALQRLVAMPGGPPGAIAVVQRGRRQKVLVAGVANLDSTQSITADDHMRLASVSKAF